MNCTNKPFTQRKVIAWLLVCALFVQVLFPIQVHMHHPEHGATSHSNDHHFIDYHNKVVGDIDQSIEEHTHTIELTTDFIAKKSVDNSIKFVLLFISLLLAVSSSTTYYLRRYKSAPISYKKYFQLSPPLRAPPR